MADRGTHVCPFQGCSKTFKKECRLESHYLSHTGERPHVCKFEGCGKSYKRVDHLTRHQQLSHVSDEEQNQRWSCEESDCEATFNCVYALKKHIGQHHEKDSYKCHVVGCGAVFHKHHQLKSHKLEEHKQGRAICCSVQGCEKSFPTQNKLKRHMKVHEGYSCTETDCGKKFDKWSLFVKHRRVEHATVHECHNCKKSFSQKQWLKQHMLTHADERMTYTCYHDNCGRAYLDQRNLNAHIRSYHDGKKFPCEHDGCSQTFTTKQKLQQHQKMHDPNRPLPKKAKKKKSKAENLSGVSMETESRGEDHVTFYSPDREDSIDLSDLSHLNTDYNAGNNIHMTGENVKEVYIDNSELEESVYQTALLKAKSGNLNKQEHRNTTETSHSVIDSYDRMEMDSHSSDTSAKCFVSDITGDKCVSASISVSTDKVILPHKLDSEMQKKCVTKVTETSSNYLCSNSGKDPIDDHENIYTTASAVSTSGSP